MFNFNKLIRIIKQDETKVFAAADLDFPDFSDSEIVSLLQYAVEQHDEDNYVKIQASKLNENELTPKLLELISSLDPGDFLDKLAKFPSSFRVTNLQLYLPQIARINQKLFDKHNLVFTCNLYFTPDKNHNALPLHSDEGHIFVQQVRGCKSWILLEQYKNGEYDEYDNMELAMLDLDKQSSAKTELNIAEGQILYFPSNMPHKAEAIEYNHSLHLTYALLKIPTKSAIEQFIIGKIIKDLKPGRYEVRMDNIEETAKDLIEHFKMLNGDEFTKLFKKRIIMDRMNILIKGIDYE